MKKITVILIVVMLGLIACTEKGSLIVKNETARDAWITVDGSNTTLVSGAQYDRNWDLNSSIFGSEEKDVEVVYSGYHVFSDTTKLKIKAGSTKNYEIDASGGCIQLNNTSTSLTIIEVYISPSEDDFWGDNDLAGTVAAGQSVAWTVSQGNWDIWVVDDSNGESKSYDNMIGLDETEEFNYDGFKNKDSSTLTKSLNALKYNKTDKIYKLEIRN